MLYNDKFKPANREEMSMESIKTRCRAIHKECMHFSGCYARVSGLNHSGASAADIEKLATTLYYGVEMQWVLDDCGKAFRFLLTWKTLRSHDKFVVSAESKNKGSKSLYDDKKTTAASVESGAELIDDGDTEVIDESEVCTRENKRPMVRKRAKKVKEHHEQMSKKIRIAAQSVAAQQERNFALKRHHEIMLFTSAPAGCENSEAVECFSIMRARALTGLKEEDKKIPRRARVQNSANKSS